MPLQAETGMDSIGVEEPENISTTTRTGITKRPNCPIEVANVASRIPIEVTENA